MDLSHFKKLKNLISESDASGSLFKANGLSGYSGEKIVGVLQRFAKYQNSADNGCYLEVGVFQGLTLISVASVLSGGNAFGIDNFSQFDPDQKNQNIILHRVQLNKLDNVHLINMDYEDALENLNQEIGPAKVGTYFVDGPHDYRSQLMCLGLIKPHLSEQAVIIVDDCNYRHVRLANRDFLLMNPQFKLLFESYTLCHPGNMTSTEEEKVRKGWWNGINIIVHDPKNILAPMLPSTIRDRSMYINDHLVHSSKYGILAPESLPFVSLLHPLRPIQALRKIISIRKQLEKVAESHVGQFTSMNTFSESLPENKFNQSLV